MMQQATLTLHRQREMLVRMKIMQINALWGLLYEFGATFARGKKALLGELELALEALANSIPQYVADSLREHLHEHDVPRLPLNQCCDLAVATTED